MRIQDNKKRMITAFEALKSKGFKRGKYTLYTEGQKVRNQTVDELIDLYKKMNKRREKL